MPDIPTIRTLGLGLELADIRYEIGDRVEFVNKAIEKDDRLIAWSTAISNSTADMNLAIAAINALDFSGGGTGTGTGTGTDVPAGPLDVHKVTIGNGALKTFTINHPLASITSVDVIHNVSPYPVVGVPVDFTSTPGQVVVGPFQVEPQANEYTVNITGIKS